MSREPDSALPFESDQTTTARAEPLREATSLPQSTNGDDGWGSFDSDVDALSLFPPDPSPRQVPEEPVSHPGTVPGPSAAAGIFRKLFPSHRAASLPSGDAVQASRDDFSHPGDARAQIAEELARSAARCREIAERNDRAASAIDGIEERLSGLDVVRDLAETMDGRLNTLRELSEEARMRTDDLRAQGETIAQRLLAADEVTSLLTTLDARLAGVVEKDRHLLASEQMVAQLERRAVGTSANLAGQLGEFETRKQVIEQAVATFEQRATQATSVVEQLTSGLDARKDIIEQAASEATRVTELVSALETRLAQLTIPEHGLGHAERTLEDIERRATDAGQLLTQRVADFATQGEVVELRLRVKSEQMAAQIERRAADASANLENRLGEFETRKQVINQAVVALEQRAAQATNVVEQLTSGLDARKDVIEQAASEATRVTGLVSALETRLAQLSTPEHGLGRAEQTLEELERRATDASRLLAQRVGDFEAQGEVVERSLRVKAEQTAAELERRAADASVNLENHLGEFETRKRAIEQAVVALEQRAAQATNDVEQLTGGLDTRKDIIEQAATEATRVAGLVSTLETRLARLTASEHGLGRAEQTLEELERRATDASRLLAQRVGDFEAQGEVIERSLREARRTIEVLSGLEMRIVNLTGSDQILDRADLFVGGLERRAASAVLQLGQATTLKNEVDQELAQLLRHLEDLTETARHGTGRRPDVWKKTFQLRVRRVRAALGPSVVARWRAMLGWWSRIPHRGDITRGLAISVLLVAGAASVARPFASMLRSLGRFSRTPVLISRPLPEAMFAVQTPPSRVVGRFARDIRRSSARLETSEDSADDESPAKRSAGAPRFIGALTIESQPPGATVFVDQQPLGKTPVHVKSLRAGEHLVWLEHEGFERWTASVLVPADRQTRVRPTLQVDNPR